MTENTEILDCAVKRKDYPEERLEQEHIALLKCVSEEPTTRYYMVQFRPEKGKYYLAVTSVNAFPILEPVSRRADEVRLIDRRGRFGKIMPRADFKVISDPCGVMERKGTNWPLWNMMQWWEARIASADKSKNEYSDEYLIENKFALVQYPDFKAPTDHLVPGKQYLALTHAPDLSPAVYTAIITDGRLLYCNHFDLDILSDPLGLLNPWKTDWHENEKMQRERHPELYSMEKRRNT